MVEVTKNINTLEERITASINFASNNTDQN